MNDLGKGSLPEGWRWVRLGIVCTQDRQIIEPGTATSANRPYLSLEHIESNTGRILRESAGPTEDEGKSTTFAFDGRHILYGKLRPYLNKVALPDFQGRCTTELIPLLPTNTERALLAWALRRQETVDAAMSGKTGSRMPRANMDELLCLEIPLPPLAEQKRIAAILNEQMATVERTRAAAEAQLVAAKAIPAAYLRTIFNSPEAQQWNRVSMASISSLVIDGPHVTPFYVPNGIPFLTVRNIVNRRIDLSEVSYISASDHAEFTRRGKAERGDILYTKDGTLGIPCVVETDLDFSFFVSVALIKLLKDRVDPYFVAFALESPNMLEQVKLLGAGAGLKHMVLKSIRALDVPLPALSIQRRIVARLSEQMATAERTRKALEEQLGTINKLPAALLRRAFSGEL